MLARTLILTAALSAGIVASEPPPAPVRVVAFGDSLVSGKGATRGHDFVSVLSNLVGVEISNAGRSGDTTGSALKRLDAVLSKSPDIAVVLVGGNDLLRFVPVDQRVENITAIAQRLRRAGARVILVGLGSYPLDPFEGRLPDVAARTGSTLVAGALTGIIGNAALMSDLIHPNDAGHRLIAERIAPTLRAELASITARGAVREAVSHSYRVSPVPPRPGP
jgi:acyl-CoA thioesterase-1